jgi:hypothetical protein
MEISADVLTAIKTIVAWSCGGDNPGDVSIDDVLSYATPVLDEFCVRQGLLPLATYELNEAE